MQRILGKSDHLYYTQARQGKKVKCLEKIHNYLLLLNFHMQ
jgi:hypothetical protein